MALQLRAPGMGGRDLFDLASRCSVDARRTGTWLLISDRLDVALAVGARGAHLPGRGLPPSDARTLWSDGCLGVSVHDVAEVEQSGYGDADYLTVGTLFSTPSHPDRIGRGAGLIAEVGAVAGGRPLLGIGGVSVRRVSEVMEVDAHGVAVIGGVWGSGESTPEEVSRRVRDFLEALPGA